MSTCRQSLASWPHELLGDAQRACVMREKASAVQAGNLAELEATLIAQAVALDAIFNELARRAALNMGEYLIPIECYHSRSVGNDGNQRPT